VLSLDEMQLGHLLEGFEAQPVDGYALLHGDQKITIPYPASYKGMGLHNGLFYKTSEPPL